MCLFLQMDKHIVSLGGSDVLLCLLRGAAYLFSALKHCVYVHVQESGSHVCCIWRWRIVSYWQAIWQVWSECILLLMRSVCKWILGYKKWCIVLWIWGLCILSFHLRVVGSVCHCIKYQIVILLGLEVCTCFIFVHEGFFLYSQASVKERFYVTGFSEMNQTVFLEVYL
jgi:hypothetical protein